MNIFALTYLYTIHKVAIQISFSEKKSIKKNLKKVQGTHTLTHSHRHTFLIKFTHFEFVNTKFMDR